MRLHSSLRAALPMAVLASVAAGARAEEEPPAAPVAAVGDVTPQPPASVIEHDGGAIHIALLAGETAFGGRAQGPSPQRPRPS